MTTRDGAETVSIVVPVLNEASALGATLGALPDDPGMELIVVDGGSSDATLDIARGYTSKVCEGPRGRARQMNLGAAHASGDILLFLHADCALPSGALGMVRRVLSEGDNVAGAFDLALDDPLPAFRVIERTANLRSRITGIPFGDQALHMRREAFERMGGFADIPLMEDIEMARRLKRLGRIRFHRARVLASARRWHVEGLVYTTMRDWALGLSYGVFGVSPERLARFYADAR